MKRTQMKRQSSKGAAIQHEYMKQRGRFLEAKRGCEIGWRTCTEVATEVHHACKRSQSKQYIADPRNFVAACSACNHAIEDDGDAVAWAKMAGFTIRAENAHILIAELEASGMVCEPPKYENRLIHQFDHVDLPGDPKPEPWTPEPEIPEARYSFVSSAEVRAELARLAEEPFVPGENGA